MNKRMIVLIAFLIGLLAFSAAPASAAQVGPVNPNAEPESAPEPDEDAAPVVKKPEAKPGSLVDYAAAGERFGQCTVLEDAVMRLLCFNRIAEDIGYLLNHLQKEALPKFGFWPATARSNTVGEKTYNMRIGPNTPYVGSSGIQRMPELILSCKVKHTEAYIDWKTALMLPQHNFRTIDVVYSFDSEPGISTRWDISSDKFAIFIPQAIEFIQSMHNKRVLNVQFTPYNEQLVILSFSLNGLENILNLMYEKCYK